MQDMTNIELLFKNEEIQIIYLNGIRLIGRCDILKVIIREEVLNKLYNEIQSSREAIKIYIYICADKFQGKFYITFGILLYEENETDFKNKNCIYTVINYNYPIRIYLAKNFLRSIE